MLLGERDEVGQGVCGQEALPRLWVTVDEREGGRLSKMFAERVALTGQDGVMTRGWAGWCDDQRVAEGDANVTPPGDSGQRGPGLGRPACWLCPWKEKLAPCGLSGWRKGLLEKSSEPWGQE